MIRNIVTSTDVRKKNHVNSEKVIKLIAIFIIQVLF